MGLAIGKKVIYMQIWEIFKFCAEGGYIAGATFKNELGQEIYFDGVSIKGLTEIGLGAMWSYVDTKAA